MTRDFLTAFVRAQWKHKMFMKASFARFTSGLTLPMHGQSVFKLFCLLMINRLWLVVI